MKNRRTQQGFTFMELMIVMILLGIMVTMVAGSYTSTSKRGRDNRRKSDLHNVQTALEVYFGDKGVYPDSSITGEITGCGFSGSDPCPWGVSFIDENDTVYMQSLPSDPQHPSQRYIYSGTPESYVLYGRLEHALDIGSGVNPAGYQDTNCGTAQQSLLCNYAVSSTNVTP